MPVLHDSYLGSLCLSGYQTRYKFALGRMLTPFKRIGYSLFQSRDRRPRCPTNYPSRLSNRGSLAMNYNAWFQCIRGCPGQYSLLEVIYRCPPGGVLLEVNHNTEAIKPGAAWAGIKLFDGPLRKNPYLY